MNSPRVSVVMTAYNHAAFVEQAIESVLAQTYRDFEFLITDDGSHDDTPGIIARYTGPEVRFFPSEINRGFSAAINDLIKRSRGEYIAILNSDDYWPLDKLEFQVRFLDEHPSYGAVFGDAVFVDERDVPLPPERKPHRFDRPNQPPGKWLRQFLEQGNCLCHPTVLVRRSCFDSVGLYDNRLRQLPDYDLWIRLSRRFSFFVSERALAFYRWGTGDNASAETSENQVRTINEHALLAEHFFSGVAPVTLREGFGDLLTLADIPSPAHLGIEKVFLYFRMTSPFSPLYRSIGLRKLADLLGSEPHREVLARDYGLGDLEFQKLAGMVQFFARAGGADMPGIDAVLPPLPAGRKD